MKAPEYILVAHLKEDDSVVGYFARWGTASAEFNPDTVYFISGIEDATRICNNLNSCNKIVNKQPVRWAIHKYYFCLGREVGLRKNFVR